MLEPADPALPPPARFPARRALLIGGAVAALLAALGIGGRWSHERALADEAMGRSAATVMVARPMAMGDASDLTLPGDVQALNAAPLYARTNGYVREWRVDIGDRVRRGALMALLDAPDLDQQLAAARAALNTAQANEMLAKTTALRWTNLLARDAVSKQETDEKQADYAAKHAVTRAAAAEVRRLQALSGFKRIVAPFDGIVTTRATQIGQLVVAGDSSTPLFTVADTRRARIFVRVPQAYSASLKVGDRATLSLPEYPARPFEARLTRMAEAVDGRSGAMLVELQAPNEDGRLKPGAYAQVRFAGGTIAGGAVRVPVSAVLYRPEGPIAAVVGAGDRAQLRRVTIGRDFGDTLEVTSGLGARDRVIENPPDAIANGDEVQVMGEADARRR